MNSSSEKSHCSVRTMPGPVLLDCLNCGYEVELWSDEEETACPACGWKVIRREAAVY